MKTKKLILKMVSIMLLILITFILPQTVKGAVLQANPTTNENPTKLSGQFWIDKVRTVEASEQAMGLKETINETTKLGETSNGIDIHMMKSTEYGAMAILSASGFGNPSNDTTIDTTTGNKTGVYMQSEIEEWVAGAGSSGVGMSGENIAHRYFNTYTTSISSSKPGDALDLIWHNPSKSNWASIDSRGFVRGGRFGVFGYNNPYPSQVTSGGDSKHPSRAVMVLGDGF